MKKVDMLTVMLSWNRPVLLEQTVRSYYRTVSVNHELIVVDNGSEEETITSLRQLEREYGFRAVYCKQNIGGLAFNLFLDDTNCGFVHFSENDIEYRPGWDTELLHKLAVFPEVGQISPFAPVPQYELGEIAGEKPATLITRGSDSVFLAAQNVGTTCIVRNELIKLGLRWENYVRHEFHFPADGMLSLNVKRFGWEVAFNDRYVVMNWGHNIKEFQRETAYYVSNCLAKDWLLISGWEKRLKKSGFRLVCTEDGSYRIEPE
jgi:glycosyltransferase involved in cell wall biosynthesis